MARSETERQRRVVRVDGHRRGDAQAAEDRERYLARAVNDRCDVLVNRLRELLGELLLGRSRHQVDLGDEDPNRHQLLLDAPDQRRLPVAPRRQDHDVLAALCVGDELVDLRHAIGERLVERQRAIPEGVRMLRRHTRRYYTRRYRRQLISAFLRYTKWYYTERYASVTFLA